MVSAAQSGEIAKARINMKLLTEHAQSYLTGFEYEICQIPDVKPQNKSKELLRPLPKHHLAVSALSS